MWSLPIVVGLVLASALVGFYFGYRVGGSKEKHYYRIDELSIGGHCGLCGAWIPDEIFPDYWRWGICDKCIKESEK